MIKILMMVLAAIVLVVSPAMGQGFPIRPDNKLTPGAVIPGVTKEMVCTPGYSKSVRHTSGALKAEIYREYGIDHTKIHAEVDHRVSLEIGGADVKENLWVESYDTQPWNAHVKDRLEDHLHAIVCSGKITLQEAQAALLGDWIAAYQKYIGNP